MLRASEACCDALRALEVAGGHATNQDDDRQRQIARAIELIRDTISELRMLSEGGLNARAAGFVLPRDPGPNNGH